MEISHDYFFFIFRSINLAAGQFHFVGFFSLFTMGSVRQFLGLGIIFH